MSHEPFVYLATPAPALLTTAQLAALSDALVGERQSCADEPTTPLGYWPTAVAALLAHADALRHELSAYQLLQAGHEMDCAALAKVGQWDRAEAASELEYTRQMGRETEKAMVKLAGRVKELQDELSEQEVEKMQLIRELLTAQRGSTTEMLTPALLASRFGLLAEERDGDVYLLPPYQSESLSKKADTARAKAKAILTGADPSPANAALIQPR